MNQSINISDFKEKRQKVQHSPLLNLDARTFITKHKAKAEAKRIIKSLKEVKDFESGKKQPKSFDEFLKDL